MNYQVTRVEFAGQPNRRVWIKGELDDSIERLIKNLKPTGDARARSTRCWPSPDPQRTLFIYRVLKPGAMDTNLMAGSLIYVLGNDVQFDHVVGVDESGDLQKWAVEAMESGEAVRAVPHRECGRGEPSEPSIRCPCNNPIDLLEWNRDTVITHNNCYSFARMTRWCAGGQGSQPGGRDSNDLRQIREGLRNDGLLQVEEPEVLRGNVPAGTFVALLLQGDKNYHFLRLDDDHWTHMHQGYAASACDADGHPIPKNGVPRANMLDFRFLEYYRVPPDRRLTHSR